MQLMAPDPLDDLFHLGGDNTCYAEVRMRQKRTPNRHLVLLGLTLATAGAVGYFLWTQHRPLPPTDQSRIAEQVALYIAAEKGTGIWEGAYRFIRINGGDPSPELLGRLARVFDVLPASKSVTRTEGSGDLGVFHRQNGGRGVIYAVDQMRRSARDLVVVDASFYPHPQGAEGYQCIVESVDGRWQVRVCELEWLS